MSVAANASAIRHVRTRWLPGPLGDAIALSFEERLLTFIEDEESEPLAIFSDESRSDSRSGDWYGEHVGKWLVAISAAEARTGDVRAKHAIERVVEFLLSAQEPSGYLGTYAEDAACRFTHAQATGVRTWDLWVHAWMILGLLRAARIAPAALGIATRIGDLLVREFSSGDRSPLDQGNHLGLSSAVLIEPLALLRIATGDDRYARLARRIVDDSQARGLGLLDPSKDAAAVGSGKAYQSIWIYQGLLALARVSGDDASLRAVMARYDNIESHHLTPSGGPWGGIATHKEVFNAKGFFSPNGLVETCSTASWLSLSRELYLATGEARYAEQFENSLLNSLLGAMDANGRDWCYFTFPNGRRNNTYHWACCKSSGAMALEEASAMAATSSPGRLSINLHLPFEAEFELDGKRFGLRQTISWDGREVQGQVALSPETPIDATVAIRIPSWAESVRIVSEGAVAEAATGYMTLAKTWQSGDRIDFSWETPIRVHGFTETLEHHGQEIVRTDYAYVRCGPLVYATGLIEGFRKFETLRLPNLQPESLFSVDGRAGWLGPKMNLRLPGRRAIPFEPYAEAGGRHDGAWRSLWLQVAWQ